MLTLSELRCEYAVDPLGIDVVRPRLSWVATAEGRGQAQTAYQVLAGTTREGVDRCEPDLWDSGKVASPANLVAYAGKPLASEMGIWWCVRAWDGNDQP